MGAPKEPRHPCREGSRRERTAAVEGVRGRTAGMPLLLARFARDEARGARKRGVTGMAPAGQVGCSPRAMTTLPVRTVSMISNLPSMRTAASTLSEAPWTMAISELLVRSTVLPPK